MSIKNAVPSRVKKLKKWEANYVAACVDTDGTVCLVRHSEGRVEIANNNLEFLRRLQLMCSGGRITEYMREEGDKRRNSYRLYFRFFEMKSLLPQIIPYLVIKQGKAKILLRRLEKYSF